MKPGNCCSRGVQKVARTLQDLLTIPTPQIVVAQNNDRSLGKVRTKDSLAARVEAIAVNKGKDLITTCHGRARCRSLRPKSPVHRLPSRSAADTYYWPIAA